MKRIPITRDMEVRGHIAQLKRIGPVMRMTPGQKRAILEGIRPPSDGDPRR